MNHNSLDPLYVSQLLSITSKHIILDRIETWPLKFLSFLNDKRNLIINYYSKKTRIYNSRHDNSLEITVNKYEPEFNDVVSKLEIILNDHKIIGIHGSRLLDQEIQDIKKKGLQPLSKELVLKKINLAYDNGHIPTSLNKKLISNNESEVDYRTGMVYFVHSISSLKDEHGFNKLFGYWGGESIYVPNLDSAVLKEIGIPCIVFLSIDIAELENTSHFCKMMMAIYFKLKSEVHTTQSKIKKTVDVLDVIKYPAGIRYPDGLFQELTNYSSWNRPLK